MGGSVNVDKTSTGAFGWLVSMLTFCSHLCNTIHSDYHVKTASKSHSHTNRLAPVHFGVHLVL